MKTRFVEAGGKSNISTELFFQPQLSDTRHKGTTAGSDKEEKQDEGANESKLLLQGFKVQLRVQISDTIVNVSDHCNCMQLKEKHL